MECCLSSRMIRRGKIHDTEKSCMKCKCCLQTCVAHPKQNWCEWCGGPKKYQQQLHQQGLKQCYKCLDREEIRRTETFAAGLPFQGPEKYPCVCGLSRLYCPCP